MGFGDDDLRGDVHFHHWIMGTWNSCGIAGDVTLDLLSKIVFASLFLCEIASPLSMVYSLKESHQMHPTLNGGGVMFYLLEASLIFNKYGGFTVLYLSFFFKQCILELAPLLVEKFHICY